MRTPLCFALLLLLAGDPAIPPPRATLADALASKTGVVALVTGSRDDLRLLERERLLSKKAAWREAAARVAWYRTLSYWGDGKDFGIEGGEPTLLSLSAEAKEGKPFTIEERVSIHSAPDAQVIGLVRRAAKLAETPDDGADTLDAAIALERGFASALRSGDAGGVLRAFAEANPGTLHAEVARARLSERPAPPLPRKKTLDALVVVPDVATFVEWIGEWDAETFFPVLIDDGHFVPLFFRAFRPAAVFFPKATRKKIDAKAFRTPFAKGSSAAGLVIVDPDSPEAAGGLALAAGRGLPIAVVKAPEGGAVRAASEAEFFELKRAVEAAAEATGLPWKGLGSGIDSLALAGRYPFGVRFPGAEEKGPYALDDAIARDGEHDLPWAFTGRLLGDAPRAAYQAMASLFLEGPRSALLFSRYDTSGEPWKTHDPEPARSLLEPKVACRQARGGEADFAHWHDMVLSAPRQDAGLVLLNSSGGSRDWSLSGDVGGCVEDVPLTVPAVVHMTHSGSMGNPYDEDTIAGRWLENGAFVYFGSYSEPFLDAFNPPALNVARALRGMMPLSRAFRREPPETRWRPWKLAYAGDPARPLFPEPLERVPAPAGLSRTASSALAALSSARSVEDRARRAVVLELMGRHDQAMDALLRAARTKGKAEDDGPALARALLGVAATDADGAAVAEIAEAAAKSGIADAALGAAVFKILRSEAARRLAKDEGEAALAALAALRVALSLPQRPAVARDAVSRYGILARRAGVAIETARALLEKDAAKNAEVLRLAAEILK